MTNLLANFKKTILLTVVIGTVSLDCISQTKFISHKSHSGSKATLALSLKKSLINHAPSNFGMAPERFVRNSNLDTVKLLSPNVAVMITSESCFYDDVYSRGKSTAQLWSAGTDTVFYHDVFNGKNSLEKVKNKLKSEYYFSNSIDSVVFIGFDGNYSVVKPVKVEPVKNELLVDKTNRDGSNVHKRPSYFMIIILSLFSTIFRSPF